jgi:hypothetical protein
MLLKNYSENKIKILFVVLSFSFVFTTSWGQVNTPSTLYSLNVRIDPDLNRIECKAEIRNPRDTCFSLTNSMKIKSVVADGKGVQFKKVPRGNSFDVTTNVHSPGTIVFEYSGQIFPDSLPQAVGTLNMIKPGLVELSDYIDWYPKMKNQSPFNYQLILSIPASYVTVLNGILREHKTRKKIIQERWESRQAVYGITLFTAPEMKKAILTKNGNTIEIYYTKLPVSYIDSMKNNLMKSMELLTELYGSPGSERLVQLVYSPRSSGAYARAPMILVSEKYALEQRNRKFGPERDFQLNSHEMAHYWSRANSGTTDDWINEGLAEYSAFMMSEKIIGKDFSGLLISEYQDIVNSSMTETSIVETPGDSRDREVNRYYKPTLLLYGLSQKYGEQRMAGFIKDLYARFVASGEATTSIFLEEVGNSFGKEAKDSFSEAVYRKSSVDSAGLPEISFATSDTIFLGKWTGPLTQFGTTTSFVLNLKQKDGNLIPSVDSPDQNVMDIPVSDLIISDDSISFKIGVASASFKGQLNNINLIIKGIFNQRGADYPLILSKMRTDER